MEQELEERKAAVLGKPVARRMVPEGDDPPATFFLFRRLIPKLATDADGIVIPPTTGLRSLFTKTNLTE